MLERGQLIQELKAMLQKLEENASSEDYSVREQAALERLIDVMESGEASVEEGATSTNEAIDRFWDAYEVRQSVEGDKEALLKGEEAREAMSAEVNSQGTSSQGARSAAYASGAMRRQADGANQERGLLFYLARHKAVAVMLCILLALGFLVLGGTVGVIAGSKVGNFNVLKNDDEGMQVITSSVEKLDAGTEYDVSEEYDSIGDLPTEYQKIFVLPKVLMDEYELTKIKVFGLDNELFFWGVYNGAGENYIRCIQQHFENMVTYNAKVNDTYSLIKNYKVGDVDIAVYKDETTDGDKYVASFIVGNNFFTIQSNINLDQMYVVIDDFVEHIMRS